jgi:peptidoglycan hydrolase CwlO-like protein
MGLTDKNVNVQYIQMDAVAKKLDAVLDWSGQWIQTQEQKRAAFQSGAQLKMQELEKSLVDYENALKEAQTKIDNLKSQIQTLQSQAADVTSQQAEVAALEESKKVQEQAIESAKEQKNQQEYILKNFESSAPVDPQQRQFYFDNLFSPLLDALTAITAIGSKTTNDGSIFQSTMYLKME